MPHDTAGSRLVYFPSLHPGLAEPDIRGAVRFLDPGLGQADDPAMLRPASLPLDRDGLAGFLREFDRLRREVKNPKDLSLLAGAGEGHFFSGTTFAVREELEDRLHPERVAVRRQSAAQLALCLAWMVEESLMELAASQGLEARFRQAMAESLGLDDADQDAEEAAELAEALSGGSAVLAPSSLAEEFGAPWRQLLPPFWAVAPEDVGLFTADPDIAAAWIEADIAFAAPSAAQLAELFPAGPPAGAMLAARETGWRLLGKSRPSREAPWLDLARLVVIRQP